MECFILAGGLSRRFGENKLNYPIEGKRVLQRVLETAVGVFGSVYVVVKDPREFDWVPARIIEDILPQQAPLVGLLTALEKAEGERFCLLAGDYPLIRKDVLERLKNSVAEDAVVFRVRGKVHPLIGIYSRNIRGVVEDQIKSGDLSLLGLLKRLRVRYIEEDEITDVDPDLRSFVNLNTKEDLRTLLGKA